MREWHLLVQILELCRRPHLPEADVDNPEKLCRKYTAFYEATFYNGVPKQVRSCKMTVHKVLHLVYSVRNCGSLLCCVRVSYGKLYWRGFPGPGCHAIGGGVPTWSSGTFKLHALPANFELVFRPGGYMVCKMPRDILEKNFTTYPAYQSLMNFCCATLRELLLLMPYMRGSMRMCPTFWKTCISIGLKWTGTVRVNSRCYIPIELYGAECRFVPRYRASSLWSMYVARHSTSDRNE